MFHKKEEVQKNVSDFYRVTLYKYLRCKYKIQIRHVQL